MVMLIEAFGVINKDKIEVQSIVNRQNIEFHAIIVEFMFIIYDVNISLEVPNFLTIINPSLYN